MSLLSIVIPCYNEAGNIPLIFRRLRETLGTRQDVEIILVDNGSGDTSPAVFEQEMATHADPRFRVVRVPVNQGYGYGITQGLAAAQGDVLAWTHADMQTDPKDVLTAFDLYQSLPPALRIIKGKRRNRRLLEALFTFGMQCVASAALKVRLDDVNAQPKLFSRAFYERYIRHDAPKDFSLDLYLLYQARRNGYEIVTIPVDFSQRLHGEAKGGGSWKTRIKLIRRTFAYIFELRNALITKEKPHADH
ncbi:glycosyltransferase family 2 protein [Acetobacter ghanensis]|uniref:Glycosyl transferase family 2 n=1 Tax=Acetobacter ghanensis TaxID=431306 RepID=A0A0U5F4P0_9PROT|nr:glycosyltransferase family 2 protein [Acetobacter ghanensis]NHO40055.1 glycosyltransferase [Acetobacter ghanensis]GBQ48138.1 glycosyltransferase [Acetobacter ghanensis DSM 18895]CEF54255.1 glycosyl transferase family 2 [Acetobacter ghanensis]